MSDPKKGPGWTLEMVPRGGNPDEPSRILMDLQMSDDRSRLTVRRPGPDGKIQEIELSYNGPADMARLFAAEVIGVIAAQANRNYQQQGLGTTMTAPITFSPEGHVLSEIYQRGEVYRRVQFDPGTLELTVTGAGGAVLSSGKAEALPIELAKALGVKLPLTSK